MDPLTLILTALVAGAAAGSQAFATNAIKDTYTGLKDLIKRKFAGKPSAEVALTEHETDPKTWEAPLKKALEQEHIDQDRAILQKAQELLDQIEAQPGGKQHIMNAVGNYIAMADRGGVAKVNVNSPPKEP